MLRRARISDAELSAQDTEANVAQYTDLSPAAYVRPVDRKSDQRCFTSAGAIGLVLWLVAAAAGPDTYAYARSLLSSRLGQVGLLIFIFAFFLHLCGGIRHLIWDAGHGFELSAIYKSGWLVVAASIVLTGATWIASLLMTS